MFSAEPMVEKASDTNIVIKTVIFD